MILFLYFILAVSIIINIFLYRKAISLMNDVETEYSEKIMEREYYSYLVKRMLATLREIDSRGAFESDDEVGAIFNEIKSAITRYESIESDEVDDESIE